jgi:tetratricopeptide (TPR) repeat protein
VNFFHLWVVVGFFGLLLLVYIFSRDTILYRSIEEKDSAVSPYLVGVTLLVCAMSIIFVVAGDYVGSKITSATEINYIEVRPSVTATIDIARAVYSTDILLGTGPNRFADAWRLHKDQAINETIFWNTDFNAGFGFVPTLFITLGILGGLVILLFHGSYLYFGYKMLLRGNSTDTFWYYFGVATFVAAVFLWGMSYVYVSGPAILLLAALFTGLSFVAYQALVPAATRIIPLVNSRRRGFFLMTIVIILITACVSAMFTVGKQYVAQTQFTKARAATTPEDFQRLLSKAYQQYPDDVFADVSAQIKLAQLRSMLSIEKPSEEEQKLFVSTAVSAVSDAEQSIRLDPTSPDGHATLASILIVLAGVGFEDAENRANSKLEDAKWRDPLNPSYAMMIAYMAVQMNDLVLARTQIDKALGLKRNYSEALFLLSQLDIKEGNIEGAIATTKQMTTLEPQNPTRYYQLGVLLAANKDLAGAVVAYETALTIDKNFANARYMMALTLLDLSRTQDALNQLKIVRETNQDNEQLKNLITQVESNGYIPGQGINLGGSVNEAIPNEQQNGEAVTTPGDPNTDLVTPVNTVGENAPAEATQ